MGKSRLKVEESQTMEGGDGNAKKKSDQEGFGV